MPRIKKVQSEGYHDFYSKTRLQKIDEILKWHKEGKIIDSEADKFIMQCFTLDNMFEAKLILLDNKHPLSLQKFVSLYC